MHRKVNNRYSVRFVVIKTINMLTELLTYELNNSDPCRHQKEVPSIDANDLIDCNDCFNK